MLVENPKINVGINRIPTVAPIAVTFNDPAICGDLNVYSVDTGKTPSLVRIRIGSEAGPVPTV